MSKTEITATMPVSEYERLKIMQEKVYRDCCDINDCSQCYHDNEDDLCDLRLLTRQIYKLTH